MPRLPRGVHRDRAREVGQVDDLAVAGDGLDIKGIRQIVAGVVERGDSPVDFGRAAIEDAFDRADAALPEALILERRPVQVAPAPSGRVFALEFAQFLDGVGQRQQQDRVSVFHLRGAPVIKPTGGRVFEQVEQRHYALADSLLVELLAHLVLKHLLCQLQAEDFEQCSGAAVASGPSIPGAQQPDCLQQGWILGVQRQHVWQNLPRPGRLAIALQQLDLVTRQAAVVRQRLVQTQGAEARIPVPGQQVRVALADHGVIGRADVPLLRVEGSGQRLEGDEAGPFMVAGPARHGQRAIAGGALGDASR